MSRPPSAKVFLVGAGPGDPGLITARGAELLGRARAVVYDQLASPELLRLCPPEAELHYAGKMGGSHHLTQTRINSLLVELALAGKTTIRLKGGDPYVFGRGGEEALALAAAGVDFEVVPGVSSAVAAPAAAGIPITHRGLSSQAVLMTGHESPDKSASDHDWEALAKMGTLSIVMGAQGLKGICSRLIAAGKDPATPAAMIERGATPRQRVVQAELGDLPRAAAEAGLGPPSVVVIGPVVSLRAKLDRPAPLSGRRIVVTRTLRQAGRLAGALKQLGAEVIERPVIAIEPIRPNPALDAALKDLAGFRWLVLTSPNGADILMRAVGAAALDARALAGLSIACIGPGTAEALSGFGLRADLIPARFDAEGLVEAFGELAASLAASPSTRPDRGPGTIPVPGSPPPRCLLARAEVARQVLPEGLAAMGFEVVEVPLYRTVPAVRPDGRSRQPGQEPGPPEPAHDRLHATRPILGLPADPLDPPPDLTTLTSASTAEGLAKLVAPQSRAEFPVASIGPVTTRAAKRLGFPVAVESAEATIPSLTEAVAAHLAGEEAGRLARQAARRSASRSPVSGAFSPAGPGSGGPHPEEPS